MTKFFEVFQDGVNRAFEVYPGANPAASSRFLVVGFPPLPPGGENLIATIDMIVDMGRGREAPPVNRRRTNGPEADRQGRRIRWDD